MKQCTSCGALKNPADFYVEPHSKGGLKAQCKECYKTAQRARYHANPQPVIDRVMAYQRRQRLGR